MNISNINYNLYKIFTAVYETNNITKTAEMLCFTQPSISQSIKELEKQLDVKLFHTNTKGIVPTKEASELYNNIKPLLVSLDNAERKIKDFNEESAGIIKFGCPSHFAAHIFVEYFQSFNKKYPNIKLEIFSALKSQLTDMLIKREIDFIIDTLPIISENQNSEIVSLIEVNNTFFTSKEFAKQHNISGLLTKEHLGTLPIILPWKSYHKVKAMLEKLQIDINSKIETSTIELTYHMVLLNLGIGYCMENFLQKQYQIEKVIKLDMDIELPKSIIACAYYKNSLNKASQEFIKGLEKFCKE